MLKIIHFCENISEISTYICRIYFDSYMEVYDLPDPCDNIDIVLRYIACKMKYETAGTYFYQVHV